jgi:hypothetical protein
MPKYDYIVREVEGYGFLPIVRDWNEEEEVARGEFRDGPLECLEACIDMAAERVKQQTIADGLDIIRNHIKENG